MDSASFDLLAAYTHLTQLDITATKVGDAPLAMGLQLLAKLRVLKFSWMKDSTVERLDGLFYLTELQALEISGTPPSKAPDAGMSRLASHPSLLSFSMSGMTDIGLGYIATLTQLQVLNCNSSPAVTDKGMEFLVGRKRIEQKEEGEGGGGGTEPSLEPSVSLNSITSPSSTCSVLSPLAPSLVPPVTPSSSAILSPTSPSIPPPPPSSSSSSSSCLLLPLPHLLSLSLKWSSITDSGVSLLSSLPLLSHLSLPLSKRLTGVGFSSFSKQGRLRSLDVAGAEMSDLGMEAISKIESLEDLVISEKAMPSAAAASAAAVAASSSISTSGSGSTSGGGSVIILDSSEPTSSITSPSSRPSSGSISSSISRSLTSESGILALANLPSIRRLSLKGQRRGSEVTVQQLRSIWKDRVEILNDMDEGLSGGTSGR